jgi:hypothetical protein
MNAIALFAKMKNVPGETANVIKTPITTSHANPITADMK